MFILFPLKMSVKWMWDEKASTQPIGPLLTDGSTLKTHLFSKIVGLIFFLFIDKRRSQVPSYEEETGKSVICPSSVID